MRPIFIGGCGRSGTTLLGAMLGVHDCCLTTPEAKFNTVAYSACLRDFGRVDLPVAVDRIKTHWSFTVFQVTLDPDVIQELGPDTSYPDLIKWIVREYGRQVGRATPEIWIDHTPDNIIHGQILFDLYPCAKMIHLIRDGRAVASSVMKLDWGPNTVEMAAYWWVHAAAHGLAAESFYGPERILQVRYECLILEPHATLQKICRFLGITYQPEMVEGTGFTAPAYASQGHVLVGSAPRPERVRAWERELTPRQVEIFESIAGEMLHCLGYGLQYGICAQEMTRQERFASSVEGLYRGLINRFQRRRRIQRASAAAMERSRRLPYTGSGFRQE